MNAARGGGLRVSVLMPTFNQSAFIGRALASLVAQTVEDFELLLVDDASTDETLSVVERWLADPRVRLLRREANGGPSAALNLAMQAARAEIVAYLPSDDVYFPEHLATLLAALAHEPAAVAAYASLHRPSDPAEAQPPQLQLVQVAHHRTEDRWLERTELVTDDLEVLMWSALRQRGSFVATGQASCQWVEHPAQQSKVIRESSRGGLNPFRVRYQVSHPLRFRSSEGELVDEVEHYRRFREPAAPNPVRTTDGLRVLLVGELAYNPERILAFEETGHELSGLWTPDGWFFNTVGPLPFGHVREVPRSSWQDDVRRHRPDVVYALLNWQAVPFAHHVLTENPGLPFVWHFKEGPWFCLEAGSWPLLVDLCTRADAVVFSSPEQQAWFETALPGRLDPQRCLVVDGDLPHRAWFEGTRSTRLSAGDGEPHTAVVGRPMGIDPAYVGRLAQAGIHTHFHGLVRSAAMERHWAPWLTEARRLAPRHFHLEPAVGPGGWVSELSRYDAGWLHVFTSANGGDIARASWDDLNYPARMSTLAAAGLPFLQRAQPEAAVATARLADALGVGISFHDIDDLAARLRAEVATGAVGEVVWRVRDVFTFHAHVDRLVDLFRRVVASPAPR